MDIPAGLHGPLLHDFGGIFIGTILSTVCFGAVSVQVMRYFNVFGRDPLSIRAVVGFLWVVEVYQMTCVTQSLHYYLIQNFNNRPALLKTTWEISIYQIGGVVSSITVETFFAYRVYLFSNSASLGVLVELFALVQCAFGVAVSIAANQYPVTAVFVEKCTWLVLTWLACQAAADLVICSTMILLLRTRRTGFETTDKVLSIMALWTINTGVVTALLSIIILIAFARAGFGYVVTVLAVPLGGVYTFTMMANLHSRTKLAGHCNPSHLTIPGRWTSQCLRSRTGFLTRILKEKRTQPDAYELSLPTIHHTTSVKISTTTTTTVQPESDEALPQEAMPPARWPFVPALPTRLPKPLTGTFLKSTAGTVGTGVTIAQGGATGTASIAANVSFSQQRFPEDTVIVVNCTKDSGRNRPSVDEQDEIDDYTNNRHTHIRTGHQNNRSTPFESAVESPVLDSRWAQPQNPGH